MRSARAPRQSLRKRNIWLDDSFTGECFPPSQHLPSAVEGGRGVRGLSNSSLAVKSSQLLQELGIYQLVSFVGKQAR